MRKALCWSWAATFFLASSAMAQDRTAENIIKKAIEADGGLQKLAKYKAAQITGKGKVQVGGGLAFSGTFYYQFPDKVRQDISLDVNGMNLSVVQVFNGKQFWVQTQGKTIEIKEVKLIQAMKEGMYAERVSTVVELQKDPKKYTLSPLGEIQVNDKTAVGVRVSSKGKKDINLYFDKKSYSLVRMEHNAIDPMSGEETQEVKTFSKFKKIDGMSVPTHIHITRDGTEYLNMEVSGFALAESLDASLFARPE